MNRQIVDFIRSRIADADFRDWAERLLCELVDIDTSSGSDLDRLARNERALLDRIAAEISRLTAGRADVQFVPIEPAIADDPDYTAPHYARGPGQADPPAAADCYRGRGNLQAVLPGDADQAGCICNAHVDTVPPHAGCTRSAGRIAGRGSADDKGPAVMLLAQIRLIEELRARFADLAVGPRVYQFVIDEETGGNGTLSLCRGERFAGWQVFVAESTGNVPYPANRGCVWFAVDFASTDRQVNLVELAAFVVLALEGAGRKLKAESTHPLFAPHHVQTSHGVLGPFGAHPSAVNDLVILTLTPEEPADAARLDGLRQALAVGLGEYTRLYGDKTQQRDAQGRPIVERHYGLDESSGPGGPLQLHVFGRAGHMGEIHDLDCAIIKTAFLVAAINQLNEQIGDRFWRLGLAGADEPLTRLTLAGGQGFVPTHAMGDVQQRLSDAVARASANYVDWLGVKVRSPGRLAAVRFDQVHNAAYASPLDMPAMPAMAAAFETLGLAWPAPAGWQVSCDARLFAQRGHPVVCYGPGRLKQAHSRDEFIEFDEFYQAVAVATLTTLGLAPPAGT